MSKETVHATVVRPGEGLALNLRGADMRIKAGADTGGATFSFIESRDPSGFAAAPHVHHEAVEAFYVLEGQYVFRSADAEAQLGTGGFILVPKGVRHSYRLATEGGRILIVYAPAGIERFWQELGKLVEEGRLTPERRNELAREIIATEFL